MGLAGPKNRRKLGEDPNNTKWSRDATTFGQKILRAHGWEPGQVLGAQSASHASFHTAGSTAPIKVALKDDTLGLGAKVRQKQGDECTGLDVFKDLLGRLNGKSDETIARERAIRSELKTSLYIERKFGPMRFVKGGLLVGDQITELVKMAEAQKKSETTSATNSEEMSEKPQKEKKSKKRRAEESESIESTETDRKEKKRKKRSGDDSPSDEASSDVDKKRRKKEKKEKKAKKAEIKEEDSDTATIKSKSKKDKKEKRKKDDQPGRLEEDTKESSERSKKKKKSKHTSESNENSTEPAITSATDSGISTPVSTGTSTPLSRHMVRSRNIASKRLAMADMAALNQIFMVKAV
ncbi:hypothetical protein BX600DRAFT_452788 [Xylariales sp. PMI_506]|nr:hypothetical protein BX600DRAFT_452788 [Xylariales sp. PMI_506]